MSDGVATLPDRLGPPADDPIAPGERIGKFIVVRRLGEGGMGTVYEARDPELSRAVAIKLLRDKRTDPMRLLREAQALARLSHPNVVGVYELGSHHDQVFVAMELIDGVTIDQHIAERACAWRDVLALYVQAGRGLCAVHEQGLVHRDFKPSNVLVDREGRVRVGDFGLARRARATPSSDDRASPPRAGASDVGDVTVDGSTALALMVEAPRVHEGLLGTALTASDTIIGTPRYMAPEQFRTAHVTQQADQFGFAVALWESLYGEHPFGEAGRALRDDDRRSAPSGRGVPSWVERVLARGLAARPEARWPSMTALLDAIERTPGGRRRIALAGAGIGAAALGVVAVMTLGGPPAVACERAGAPVAAAWTATARADITAAFAKLGAVWAPTAGPTATALDRWAARATDIRVEACRATHERASQTAALLDKRVACLDAQQPVFDALVGELARVDQTTARQALSAVAALPAPETCNATRLGDALATPRDPAIAAALASATIAIEFGRPDALAKAEHALGLATAGGAAEPRGRARLLHARALAATDRLRARADLAAALADAAAARDPGLEAEVLLRTLVLAATDESIDRIDALVPIVRVAVTRAGDPRPLARELAFAEFGANARFGRIEPARAACDRGIALEEDASRAHATATCACRLALLARLSAVAAPACETALAEHRRTLGDRHPLTADIEHDRITSLIYAQRLAEAETAAEANVALYTELYGRDTTHVVGALQLMSVVQERRDKVRESRATLEAALAINDRVAGLDAPTRAGLLMELAERATTLQDRAAIGYADAGLIASERLVGTDHRDLAAGLIIHAKAVALDPDQLPRSLESWRRAIAVTEKHAGPGTFTLASVLSSYALFLALRARWVESLGYIERATPIYEALGEKVAVARSYGLSGSVLAELGRKGPARIALDKARAAFVALGADYADELVDVDFNLKALR